MCWNARNMEAYEQFILLQRNLDSHRIVAIDQLIGFMPLIELFAFAEMGW